MKTELASFFATFLAWAGASAGVALAVMLVYDALGHRAVRKAIDALPDVPEADKAFAWSCMWRALVSDWKIRFFDLSAPIVMAMVIPFVPRSANKLPPPFSAWDNNISLNGDSGGVWVPANHPEFIRYASAGEGVWVDYHDVLNWDPLVDCLQVTYDTPFYDGDAYYAKGHHPRSRWARYVWVGLRNRATKLALDLGAAVNGPIDLISGSLAISTGQSGHFLLRCGDAYHFKSIERVSVLGRDFARIRSYGFKLEIALKSPKEGDRVAVVAIGWSAKAWKEA
ncbi:hypothetical protein [Ottowia sp. VDI28]|uniref:hypothetical protein n=1 Tax=Ottowia sp. VDI28 TaxID=3133968 RepID=UPI003C2F0D69